MTAVSWPANLVNFQDGFLIVFYKGSYVALEVIDKQSHRTAVGWTAGELPSCYWIWRAGAEEVERAVKTV
jgi:hypothetical protein